MYTVLVEYFLSIYWTDDKDYSNKIQILPTKFSKIFLE